jgi:osmotically-inducible protein OsmY
MSSTIRRASVPALLVVAALSGCAVIPHSSDQPVDQKITAAVQTRFDQHADLEAPNLLEVQTVNRIVYLSGTVSTGLQRAEAESAANEVQGVRKVVDSVAVDN